MRVGCGGGDDGVAAWGVVGADPGGGVVVEADEVDGGADGLHVGGGELGGVGAVVGEVGVGVFAFHDGGEVAGVLFAHGFAGGGDVLWRLDDGGAGFGVFGEADFDVPGLAWARMAWTPRPWARTAW